MQYNTQREHLVMPEYGRGIQNMVDVAVSIPERESRQRCAETIIAIMARIQQGQDQQPDFEQKLWNHLARMSHYKLDIDYPVEIVPEEQAFAHAAPLHYPMKHIRRKHYGYQVENALKYAMQLPEGEERDALVGMIANQMKQNLYNWNRDSMDDNLVAQDLARYTDGQIRLDLSTFQFASVQTSNHPVPAKKSKTKK